MGPVSINALWIYPVKSLAGIPLSSAKLTPAGLAGDREWMLVDDGGRFVTQRQIPQLATLGTAWKNGQLTLSHRGQSVTVHASEARTSRSVTVWRHDCSALMAPAPINRWINEQLKPDTPLTLVRFDPAHQRPLEHERFGQAHTHFADAAPYLISNQASLEALNQRLAERDEPQIDMRRFRPNIVLSRLPAFAEHRLTSLQSEALHLALIDPCQRCAVITVDQSTGERTPTGSPLRTLASINAMPGKPKAPAFGVNSLLKKGDGQVLRVGDLMSAFQPSYRPEEPAT